MWPLPTDKRTLICGFSPLTHALSSVAYSHWHPRTLIRGVPPLTHAHSYVEYPHWHTHTHTWSIPTDTRTLKCGVPPLTHALLYVAYPHVHTHTYMWRTPTDTQATKQALYSMKKYEKSSSFLWFSSFGSIHALSRVTSPHWYTRRLLKITGLFCKRDLYKRLYSAKETYHFKEPTNRSHPIRVASPHWHTRACGSCPWHTRVPPPFAYTHMSQDAGGQDMGADMGFGE